MRAIKTFRGRGEWILALLLLGAITSGHPGLAEAAESSSALGDSTADSWLESVQFLILRSTTEYGDALETAERASRDLGIPLDLRGLRYDESHGLTLSAEDCGSQQVEYPCYWPRGRYDEGVYVSIERSDAYESFRDGYFIVVAASSPDSAASLDPILARVRSAYADAYVKTDAVYMGCIH